MELLLCVEWISLLLVFEQRENYNLIDLQQPREGRRLQWGTSCTS